MSEIMVETQVGRFGLFHFTMRRPFGQHAVEQCSVRSSPPDRIFQIIYGNRFLSLYVTVRS